jgi:gliding motility-associated-like protein
MKILFTPFFFLLGMVLFAQLSSCEIETINKDFEQPDIPQTGWPSFINANTVDGWGTTASDNIIEFWPNSNNGGGTFAYSGDQYIELNGNEQAGVFQDFETALAGVVFNFTFAHRGRMGLDVCRVLAGPPGGPYTEIGQYSADNTAWVVHSGNYTVPTGQPFTRFIFEAVSTATGDPTVGNFLDAIDFKSNFGLATPPLIGLFCEDNIADDIESIGIGTWSINPGNPSPTFIDDITSNTPIITGFLLTGNYNYTWSNGICEAELTIYYNNDQIAILEDNLTDTFCDNESIVDLTQYNLQFSTETGVNFRYYENLADAELGNTNFISNPVSYLLTQNTTLYVRLDKTNFCSNILELNLILNQSPVAENPVNLDPKCDENGDGLVEFDLDEAIPFLVLNPDGPLSYTYYLSQSDAVTGTNPQSSMVSIPSGTIQTFWVVISNGNCETISSIIITANEGVENVIDQSDLATKTVCDEDFDGAILVDLSEWNSELIASTIGILFSYYESEANAFNETSPIGNFMNYPITQSSTTIWVVIKNELGCKEIRFVQYEIGDRVPVNAMEFNLESICLLFENTLDLTQLETDISTESMVQFIYYTNLNSAQIGGNDFINNPSQYPITTNGYVYVRLEKEGFCPEVIRLNYEIGEDVPHNIPSILPEICEGEILDLTQIQTQISTNPDVQYSYFHSENDAMNNLNPIANPSNYQTNLNNTTLYVRVELEGYCPVILPFEFQIYPLPENPITEIPTLCYGNEVILDAGQEFPEGNYIWTWENGQHIGSTLVIQAPGTYHLTITSNENCESSFSYELVQPAPPVITQIVIGDNYIIVETSGNGTSLEFSLDGVFWQSNPRFDNLIPGEDYTVYVRESGCEPVYKQVTLPFIANFISPNGDGINDTWMVRGFPTSFDCSVKIFDRYGKIFVDSKPQTINVFTWDGKYKGDAVPSGDYWYIITAKDENQVVIKYVGHISVRNR